MSWCVFWIFDLPLKEATGDSEDKIQEENTGNIYGFDENDTGSCCGDGNRDDDAKIDFSFLSKEVLEHKGETYNEISLKEVDASKEESQHQRLRNDAKEFWEACIAHGY